MNTISPKQFQKNIYGFFEKQRRDLPWRHTENPYHILVSEFMLQQTQVERVKTKYLEFLKNFPAIRTLARAPLVQVLSVWQGLGYNRRARSLKLLAEEVVQRFAGIIPHTEQELLTLPGVGKATAGSLLAFAYNIPSVFIETNIRTVFIHSFFKNSRQVNDSLLLALIEKMLDRHNPRRWYSALMDYGVFLKKKYPDLTKRSVHFKKQSPFEGSNRQIRGLVLKLLARGRRLTAFEIARAVKKELRRVQDVLVELEREKFLESQHGRYRIR